MYHCAVVCITAIVYITAAVCITVPQCVSLCHSVYHCRSVYHCAAVCITVTHCVSLCRSVYHCATVCITVPQCVSLCHYRPPWYIHILNDVFRIALCIVKDDVDPWVVHVVHAGVVALPVYVTGVEWWGFA